METDIEKVLEGALGGMTRGPRPLNRAIEYVCEDEGIPAIPQSRIAETLLRASKGEKVAQLWQRKLAEWDHADAKIEAWAAGTRRGSKERRDDICRLLGMEDALLVVTATRYHCYPVEEPMVFDKMPDGWEPWYTADRPNNGSFYFDRYIRSLETRKRPWDPHSVIEMKESTTKVVERLCDPLAPAGKQTKGLVVGYVQSGKTAHFIGVIAKAIDAGYRFVIVLAGLTTVLRKQTQERIDDEIVYVMGKPDGSGMMQVDQETALRPKHFGAVDVNCLTSARKDYQGLGINSKDLVFEAEDGRQFYELESLAKRDVVMVVVKKNTAVMKKLVKDIRDTGRKRQGVPWKDVPALLIDDEADQASVNTKKNGRTPCNQQIVSLLKLLPRCQYVGYTATPFANIFIDPADKDNLFPDYVMPLRRPIGYMGLADFFDLEATDPGDPTPNEDAFVRKLPHSNLESDDEEGLRKVLDSYVISGAIKLYRSAADGTEYKHHTMLVHSSHLRGRHSLDKDAVVNMFRESAYNGPFGMARLQKLFDEDFKPVWADRGGGLPMPNTFAELAKYVGDCLTKIGKPEEAVKVLNMDNPADTPDFDNVPHWKILVGGAKLSRGYTVEGLTISYYTRKATAHDTLMQMVRWAGYRPGYGDLVRLFLDADGDDSLLDAFKGICRDEAIFRRQIEKLDEAQQKHGAKFSPAEILRLVPSYLLPPTAANKSYNVEIKYQNYSRGLTESTMIPRKNEGTKRETNRRLMRELMEKLVVEEKSFSGNWVNQITKMNEETKKPYIQEVPDSAEDRRFFAAVADKDDAMKFITGFQWSEETAFADQKRYLLDTVPDFPNGILDWVVLWPQMAQKTDIGNVTYAGKSLTVSKRNRADYDVEESLGSDGKKKKRRTPRQRMDESEMSKRVSTFTGSKNRAFGEYLAGIRKIENPSPDLKGLLASHQRRAVLMIFPTVDQYDVPHPMPDGGFDPQDIHSVGFTLIIPDNGLKNAPPTMFGIKDPSRAQLDVIPSSDDAELEEATA